jgi:tagatose 6-phosphate kinase
MILTVTLNMAVDVTYFVREFVLETSVRVEEVRQRAGGKGVNVARVLSGLGVSTVVTGFVGGASGATLQADLVATGLTDGPRSCSSQARRSTRARGRRCCVS